MAPRVPDAIGDYKIQEEIGHGGMGTLYRARDPKIGRDVAIKLLREGLDDKDMRERFAREARSAGRLKHGNIVTIFELGEHNDMPFIAMEFVQGETLASFLKRRPPVSLSRKLQIMDQVCAGLHYAHRMGIVHRDIKPANIMIDDEGTVKILDFGIARMGTSKITQTGMVIGTLNYMAPEQMKGMATDARADQFSIGAVFYELLSYRNAFAGDAPSTVMHKILYGRPDQLEIICPNLDPALVAIVTRCIEKLADNRYPDLGAVRSALTAVARRIQAAGEPESNEDDRTMPVIMPGMEPRQGQPPSSKGSRKDSANVEQMRLRAEQTRTKQLQKYLDAGRRALEQGDYDAAFSNCEQALVLDPTNAHALEIEAAAREAVDRQLEEQVNAARAEIDRGALTKAGMLADQVLAIRPESAEAEAIRHEIEDARRRLAEEQARARERQRAVAQALSEAQRHFSTGSLDAAEQAIDRALALDPAQPDALALKEKIDAAVTTAREARRRADDEARARKTLEEAKRVFGAGDHAAAFSMLAGPAAKFPFVAEELDALRIEAREMERRRTDAERQRLEAEAVRLKQESDAARKKLQAEVERLKHEAEAERRGLEAEAARLKREADAERKKREAEAERVKRHAEVAKEPAREDEPSTVKAPASGPGPKDPASVAAAGSQEARQKPLPESPRIYQPPKAPAVTPIPPASSGSKGLTLGAIALVALIVIGLGSVIVLNLMSGGDPAPQPVAENPPPGSGPSAPPSAPPVATPDPPAPPPASPPAPDPKEQLLASARAALDGGDFDTAIRQSEQVLALEADHADATQLRARALERRAAGLASPKPPAAVPPKSPPVTPAGGGITTAPTPPAPSPSPAPGGRERDLTDRYNRAKSAVDGGSFATAIPLLEQLQRDEPGYRDVPALLARARDGVSASAKQAFDNGAKLENSGDLPGALQQYERGRQLDPTLAPTADPLINRVRARMKTEGAAAFTSGRQYDALDRVEQAIAQYERAIRYLPDDDPNRRIARERLEALRKRQ